MSLHITLHCALNTRKETYEGESSRSVFTRAWSYYEAYQQDMRKNTRLFPTTPGGEEQEYEESRICMVDHTRSHHGEVISENPKDNYDFFVVDSWWMQSGSG